LIEKQILNDKVVRTPNDVNSLYKSEEKKTIFKENSNNSDNLSDPKWSKNRSKKAS